ncbi:MAG: HypC/HybG/HupF family hydrogenase formation chaperone [Pseudomonadota bacterium]
MCFGVPMQIQSIDGSNAVCKGHGRTETVALSLIDEVKAGAFVLVYLGSAVRELSELEATQISDAIAAIDAASRGEAFDHLIQDLIDREPELPAHLRPKAALKEAQQHAPVTEDFV